MISILEIKSDTRGFKIILLGLSLLAVLAGEVKASEFKGVIGRTEADSKPYWPEEPTAQKDAPNVLIWLMDDVGFGHAGSFGGLIETATLDQLARDGLRFTNFHSTPLCSPTRASLLTGRNPHNAGVGAHAGTASPYPGYNARIPKSAASIARILKDQGYATYAIGKWDQLPMEHTSVAGPFDYWPSGQGFDHFYGFLHYDANHFDPTLWENHTPVVRPAKREPHYHLTTDMADKAISYINQLDAVDPNKPFLLYWSTGAVHAPHHAPQSYIDKYQGRFDEGWHATREAILSNQKASGIVPNNAQLPVWPEAVPEWTDLSADEQRLARRQMEAFAGMLDHTDEQFGRIISALEAIGKLDNTIIVVLSDNGASAEGGLAGTFNEGTLTMGQASWEDNLKFYDQWGGPKTYPHYAVGWAVAGNTPFKYYKQSAYDGGNRVPMLISWKKGIKESGLRPQFHHVSDVVPTILDLAKIQQPEVANGVKQRPMDGISFRYAFEEEDAPTEKQVQYFELWGNRGIWADGWKANLQIRIPWTVFERPDVDGGEWTLYHVNEDFNERINLADSHPEKLEEMKNLFHQEAQKNQVYPLLPDSHSALAEKTARQLKDRDYRFVYGPDSIRIPSILSPPLAQMSFEATANLNYQSGDKSSVLFSHGGDDGGFALYIKDGKPVFVYNMKGIQRSYLESSKELPNGASKVTLVVDRVGQRADIHIDVEDETVAQRSFDHLTWPAGHESFDVGADYGSPVSEEYAPRTPSRPGLIQRLTFVVHPAKS